MLYWLGKGLAEMGHRVTLIAHPGNHIPGVELRALNLAHSDNDGWQKLIPAEADVLHLQETPASPSAKPFVVTIHGNGRPGEKFHPNSIFVSRKHAANHGSVHYVHNGLDPAEYRSDPNRGDYAVFLAKASWDVKNLRGAIEFCRRAGIELQVIGSRNWPLNLQRKLPPLRGVRYLGMTGGAAKREVLARARFLVFPVRWEEPFGLAVTEALASGCYVLATPYGSLPEIVTRNVGMLSARGADLLEAARHPQKFSPEACRERVLKGGFTHLDMAKNYLAYYERIVARGRLGPEGAEPPQTVAGFFANRLLPWES